MQWMFPDGILKATNFEGAAGAVDTHNPRTAAAHAARTEAFTTS